MNIVMIEEDLSPRTGSRRFIYKVTQQLLASGNEVKIFACRLNKKKCFQNLLNLPVEVVTVEESHVGRFLRRATGRNLEFIWAHTRQVMEISERTADLDPDVVIFHYTGEHWLLPYFYYLKEPVGVVCLHVVPPVSGSLSLPFQRLTWHRKLMDAIFDSSPTKLWEAISIGKLGMIITHSRYLLEQARAQGLIGPRKTEVISLGVDPSEFCPTGEEEPFALFLGRIHPHKSLELAVRAMKKTRSDKSLIIAGDIEDSHLWYKDKLESIAKRMNLSNRLRIILSPTETQVVRLMQTCSVFLFPSTIDTFGLVVLEAMACGKPVVACRAGGIPELLSDCGFLLEPEYKQWEGTVERLFSDGDLRSHMGRKAFERSKLYSWERTTESLLRVTKNFLASNKPRR